MPIPEPATPPSETRRPAVERLRRWGAALAEQWSATQGSLVAAGVAFYCFLALVPAIGAFAGIYTLVVGQPPTQPELSHTQLEVVPQQLQDLVAKQLDSMQQASRSSIGLGSLLALGAAVWSCSAALKHLLTALRSARSVDRITYVRARLLGLALAVGLLVFLVVAFTATAIVPGALATNDAPAGIVLLARALTWPLIGLGMLCVAAVLFRVSRPEGSRTHRFFTVGAGVAALVWLLASVGFSTVVESTSHLETSYGVLASAIGLLMWFWLFAGSLLLGVDVDVLRAERAERSNVTVRRSSRR